MSDLSRALVPVSQSHQQSLLPYQPDEPVVEASDHRRHREERRRPQNLPSRNERTLFIRCVTNRPVSFLYSIQAARSLIMDRNSYNGYNSCQNNYPTQGYGGNGYQGQGGYNPQQQYMQNQNQQPGAGGRQAPGGGHNVNHYHGGSHFNFTFSNAGAYDLNIRIPGLIGDNSGMPLNQQPQQSLGAVSNPGLGWGNSNDTTGYNGNQNYGNYGSQPNNMNHHSNQQHSGFFTGNNGAPIVLPGGTHNPQGNGGFQGQAMSMPRILSRSNSLRRVNSTNILSDFPEDDDDCFGSQNSKRM